MKNKMITAGEEKEADVGRREEEKKELVDR
jgi:hypothetical protein